MTSHCTGASPDPRKLERTRTGGQDSRVPDGLCCLERTDHSNPGPSGNSDLLPYCKGDLAGKARGLVIVDGARVDKNLHLTPCLQRKRAHDPGKAGSYLFDGVHPPNVGFEGLTSSTRPSSRDSIRGLDDEVSDTHRINLVVMSGDSVNNLLRFTITTC